MVFPSFGQSSITTYIEGRPRRPSTLLKNKVFVWRVLHFSKKRGVNGNLTHEEREAREKREPGGMKIRDEHGMLRGDIYFTSYLLSYFQVV